MTVMTVFLLLLKGVCEVWGIAVVVTVTSLFPFKP